MIDVEDEIFGEISAKVCERYPDLFMTSEYVESPASFPCASLVEMDNAVLRDSQTASGRENHASVMYELNVYSNKAYGKKTECREILALIDEEMLNMGFSRSTLTPVPNENDSTIYRMVARYRAAVSSDLKIFRR